MFCLLACLTLFFALQRTVSSDEVVSLNCNNTVSVTAGENVTLNCSISLPFVGREKCSGQRYGWYNTNGIKLCETDSTKYTCAWDALTYVSLTISNDQEELNVTVEILSNCGMGKSPLIRVQRIRGESAPPQDYSGRQEEPTHVTTIVLCVFASVVAVVILYFLYRAYRHRVKERTGSYSTPGSRDSTAV